MSECKALDQGLFELVRAYSEEFGSQNVLLAVPEEWEPFAAALTQGELERLAFTTDGTIEVSAFFEGRRQLHYQISSEDVLDAVIQRVANGEGNLGFGF